MESASIFRKEVVHYKSASSDACAGSVSFMFVDRKFVDFPTFPHLLDERWFVVRFAECFAFRRLKRR